MQYPFIKYLVQNKDIKIIPILISELSNNTLNNITSILKEHFDNPKNLFIFSSDFCHWGKHFEYQPFIEFEEKIYQKIEELDL